MVWKVVQYFDLCIYSILFFFFFFFFFYEDDDKEKLEINNFIQQACIKLLTLYIFTILNKYSYFELSIH